MNKLKLTFLALILVLITTSGFGCTPDAAQQQAQMTPLTLNVWGTWDDSDSFSDIIANYQALHPFITINYRKLRPEEYEQALLNALAEGNGPDIFTVQNTWVKKYLSKITPLPDQIDMIYPQEQGVVQKTTVAVHKATISLRPVDVKNNFVPAVYNDVVFPYQDPKSGAMADKVFALPLAVDTMAMYYNIDLLNNANISQLPTLWNTDFNQDVAKLTKQDSAHKLVQSGVALGGSANIDNSGDILSLLMMQSGTQMMNGDTVTMAQVPSFFAGSGRNPTAEAVSFYTSFADPSKLVYCWNNTLNNSTAQFTADKLAILFAYSSALPLIRNQNPKLNFGVQAMPQIQDSQDNINFANYWAYTVSNRSAHAGEAWDFIQFMTSADQAKLYLARAKKPTALRALVDSQANDPDLGVFAKELLTAQSWYHGGDPLTAQKYMNDLIDQANASPDQLSQIIDLAANRIQQTINP